MTLILAACGLTFVVSFLFGFCVRRRPLYQFNAGIDPSAVGNLTILSPHVIYSKSYSKFLLIDEKGNNYQATLRRISKFGPNVEGEFR